MKKLSIGLFASAIALFQITSIALPKLAHATTLVTQECTLYQWYQHGHGWIAGSEELECDTTITTLNDGSQFAENQNNSCGNGNPCPQAPGDSGAQGINPTDAEKEKLKCEAEKIAEQPRNKSVQQAIKLLRSMDPKREHVTFIVRENGQYSILTPQSGPIPEPGRLPTVGTDELFDQLAARGLNESHIVVDIHSHLNTLGLTHPETIADATFVNGFPSIADYRGVAEYRRLAEFFGADLNQWDLNFSHLIIDPEGVAREFEDYQQPAIENFPGGVIPKKDSENRRALEDRLKAAKDDAEGNKKC